jgi:putative endonuclease
MFQRFVYTDIFSSFSFLSESPPNESKRGFERNENIFVCQRGVNELLTFWCKRTLDIYQLISKSDGKFYTGFTTNIENRLKEHNSGKVLSTRRRIPLYLVYYEFSLNIDDAIHREQYLKTTYGKRYMKQRLKYFLINS